IVGGALQLMVVSTLYTWLPSHLDRSYGLTPSVASSLTAAMILAGLVGTIAFAYVADRAAARDPRGRLRVPAALAVATAVLLATAFATLPPGPWQFALVVAGGLTATAAVGPVAAVATDVVRAGLRATAIGAVVVGRNLLGIAVGPLITGVLADLYGLPTALAVMPAACGVAALAFWSGSRRYPADRAAVDPPAERGAGRRDAGGR
ncbi:MAG: MFS transporter, partial [Pseudonocardia sp.]|nr:MFS transporter [Pseudonocardia sp.]